MRFFLRYVLICLFSASIYAEEPSEELMLSFPIFASGNDELMVGYGDWCPPDEGPHPGIDFYADDEDYVLNPFNEIMYVLGAGYDIDNELLGCILGLGLEEDAHWGWALKHFNHLPFDPLDWCGEIDHHRGSSYNAWEEIDECIEYAGAPRHLHIDWSFWEDCPITPDEPDGGFIPEGFHEFVNPLDYFNKTQLEDYDEISFKRVFYENEFLWPRMNTGAWFMPDGKETHVQISDLTNYQVFQNVVSGAIDIAISPYSILTDYPDNNTCGIYSIGYKVYHKNPFTMGWESTESTEGNWEYRELFRADGQTPWDQDDQWDTDEYRAFLLDGNLVNQCGIQIWELLESAYIVTNSGALDPSQWTTGWDNVWTDPYVNNWRTGICKGAWDTFLARRGISGEPSSNREAFFPDGRYAVNVTAVSHGLNEHT